MHIAALDRQAGLTAIHHRSPYRATGSNIEVGIFQHDHRVLTAEFQHHGQQLLGSGPSDALSRCHTPGKNHLVDVRFKKGAAHPAPSDENLHEVGIEPGRQQQPLQFQRHQGRELRWLENYGVAHRQCRDRFNRRSRERIVPRGDDADDAIRLSHQPAALSLHGQVVVRECLVAKKFMRRTDREFRRVEHDSNLGIERLDGRFTGLTRDKPGEF